MICVFGFPLGGRLSGLGGAAGLWTLLASVLTADERG